jgi:hypothetical protein
MKIKKLPTTKAIVNTIKEDLANKKGKVVQVIRHKPQGKTSSKSPTKLEYKNWRPATINEVQIKDIDKIKKAQLEKSI